MKQKYILGRFNDMLTKLTKSLAYQQDFFVWVEAHFNSIDFSFVLEKIYQR